MESHLKKVLSPITISGLEIKNRVVRTAHGTNIGEGTMSDDLIAYHEARARGGVGLTILEILGVHPSSAGTLNTFDPTLVERYQVLMETVRPHGMRVFQQIWHGGHNGTNIDGSPPWSASDVPSPTVGVVPVAMTKTQIDEIVGAYAHAATLCQKGGLDGVEIHCAHGYLIQQFLSPLANHRSDAYGGSFENRARLGLDVLRAIRQAVGAGFPLGVRLSPDGAGGGVDVDANIELLKLIEEEGLADFVDVSLGSYYAFPKMIGAMHEPVAYEMASSEPVTKATELPTIVTGRFRTLEEADQVIVAGAADMVGMTRAHIADPDIVAKTIAGAVEQIRPCIACNQGCVGQVLGPLRRMGCVVNPAVGRERFLGDDKLQSVTQTKRIVVVGGGPAGLEAARVAATRGHRVTLLEAQADLGGQINVAKRAPFRHGLGDITYWLEQEIFRLGAVVHTGTYATVEDVLGYAPDVVVVATGSQPRMDGVQIRRPGLPAIGMDQAKVLSSVDLLTSSNPPTGSRAVVFDDVGHFEALAATEHLVNAGFEVTFVTSRPGVGDLVEPALLVEPAMERFGNHVSEYLIRTGVDGVNGKSVTLRSNYGDVVRHVTADVVVFVSHNQPVNEVATALSDKMGAHVHLVGDALSPRFLGAAIDSGHQVGARI